MKRLIGIHGKARSGKDTIARHLWETYGFTRIAFADPVKLAAQQMFALTNEQTWDDKVKEDVIPYWGLSPRRMFQLLGTDASKPIFGNDVWINRWHFTYQMLKETDDIVVPDVRHEDEAAHIRSLGGKILHLSRPGIDPVAAHQSENGIKFEKGDWMLVNDQTIAYMNATVDSLLMSWMEEDK